MPPITNLLILTFTSDAKRYEKLRKWVPVYFTWGD